MADPLTIDGLVGDPSAVPPGGGVVGPNTVKPAPNNGTVKTNQGSGVYQTMGPGSMGGPAMVMPGGPSDGPVPGGGVVGGGAASPNPNPGVGTVVGGTNVASQSSQMANNAEGYLGQRDGLLSDRVEDVDADTAGTNLDGSNYQGDADALNVTGVTASTSQASQVSGNNQASTYDAETTFDRVNNNLADAATMETNQDAIVDPDDVTMDMQGMATGINEDGSINATGAALNDFAHQNISNVIDTSTVAGKLLAQSLGEGNYVDSKATVQGQLEILTAEFVDSVTGEPKIPTWAAGLARNVSRSIAFKGITGTAATGALAQAMIEATLPIAQADSQFYQTLTIKNLDNKQQMIINKANVLSKMELANLDVRTSLAVNNAKTFMQYDMANLANEQQAEIVNTQAKVQSILEDGKQINVARRFGAEAQNEMDMFYDNLGASIDMYNVGQKNQMAQFNAGVMNDTFRFNASLENSREQFYTNMQFAVDSANAKWRQEVTMTNSQMRFQAAATDVKNIIGLTTEGLNRLWDRADSLLDYAWKEGENEKDRELKLELAKMELQAAQMQAKAKKKGGLFGAIGSIAGSLLGTKAGSSAVMGGIGKVLSFLPFSDERLKTNIRRYGQLPCGAGLFEWEWTDEAIKKGAKDLPTWGVIAQDVQKHVPEAVRMGADGYLRVDYEKVA